MKTIKSAVTDSAGKRRKLKINFFMVHLILSIEVFLNFRGNDREGRICRYTGTLQL